MTGTQPNWRIRSVYRPKPHYPVVHRQSSLLPSFIIGLAIGIILGTCITWLIVALSGPVGL